MAFSASFHLYVRCLALNSGGRFVETEALGLEQHAVAVEARSQEGRACFAMFLIPTYVGQGRLATAACFGREAAADTRELGWPLTMPIPLIYLASALALQGDCGGAGAVLAEIDALGVPREYLFGPELLRARAWCAVADGVPSDGHAHLEEAAAMARAVDTGVFEAGALHDLARLGRAAQVVPRLQELANAIDGPLWPVCAAHATALARGDAAALAAASSAFEDLRATLLGAEAAADCAVAWRRAHEPKRAAEAERRSRMLALLCEGARTPAVAATAAARATLTPRELEIARLAASGLANKAIAARLFLSHRTVENKLHTCYAKLGAGGRADLLRALEHL